MERYDKATTTSSLLFLTSVVRLSHELNPSGILSMKEVQVLDETGNNVAMTIEDVTVLTIVSPGPGYRT